MVLRELNNYKKATVRQQKELQQIVVSECQQKEISDNNEIRRIEVEQKDKQIVQMQAVSAKQLADRKRLEEEHRQKCIAQELKLRHERIEGMKSRTEIKMKNFEDRYKNNSPLNMQDTMTTMKLGTEQMSMTMGSMPSI